MKNRWMRMVALCLVVALLMGVPVYAAEAEENETAATETVVSETQAAESKDATVQDLDTFSCYTYDEHNNKLNGFWDEADNMWYLFVTSTQTLENTALYYTGSVSAASAGTLDVENAVVTGAFAASGDQVELTCADGTVVTVTAMQSGLTSVHITLEGTTLDEIHADKDTKHKGNSIYIMDPNDEYDLVVEGSLEIKGRGNSTWRAYEKKAYQIKFDDKTSVMGMGKAKKWVLLANASDDSMMRTQLVYNMAKKLDMGFVCSLKYVDLWIEGEYRGTFLIGDKVEPGSSRLDLANDAGALFEHDEAFYMEEDYWLYSTMMGRHFVLKEIMEEEDAIIEAAMLDFEQAVDELVTYLYSTPSYELSLEELSTMIDVDSFIKYYLVNEYALNRESFATSFYWYKDGPDDVIHLGPIWDFDTCMGNDGESYTASYGDEHILFRYLLAAPAFYNRTMELLEQYKADLDYMSADVDNIKAEISESAQMNYVRWDVLGKPNPKGGADFYPTFDEAVSAVQQWLKGRADAFQIAECRVVTSVVSDDCYDMEVYFRDGQEHNNVRFAVWSLADGQDDVRWYDGHKDENGGWYYPVDLGKHNSAGMYRIDAYVDNERVAAATGRNYVVKAQTSRYQLSASVSENCEVLTITMSDQNLCSDMAFAVWSEEGNQDDLKWYDAQRNSEGLWTVDVDLRKHQTAGVYHIHAYTGAGDVRRQLDTTTANVAFVVSGPKLNVEVNADSAEMILTLENADGYARIWVPVWSSVNGQDDLCWYELTSVGQGVWTGTVDLIKHGDAGAYLLHVYAGNQGPEEMLLNTQAYVEKMPIKQVEAVVSDDCSSMEVVLRGLDGWKNLWVPVWSDENGQDDLQWYQAVKQADGTYVCLVDLELHKSAGRYQIHVYGGEQNPEKLVGYTTAVVSAVPGSIATVKVSVEYDDMSIVMKNLGDWEKIWVPVWSEENAQDDIRWYEAQKQDDGTWRVNVDLTAHKSTGKYHIHVYGGATQPEELVASATATVITAPGTVSYIKTTVENGELTVHLKNPTEDWTKVWVPVWSDNGGQDDIRWYEAVEQSDGSWLAVVDLSIHGDLGNYYVHVYGGETSPEKLVADAKVLVEELEAVPQVSASVSGKTMTLTVRNAEEFQRIWIPVWTAENGTDDIQWYEPVKQADGNWVYEVDLSAHGAGTVYHVHVYTGDQAPSELITYIDVTVSG